MNNFNFDRCLKFVFYGGNLGTTRDANSGVVVQNTLVVEYNPRKASYLCPKLEATITDTPASTLKNRPGYEAELKIYNPNHDILSVIASGVSYIDKADTVKQYYDSKVRVAVYAGYFVQPPQDLKKEEQLAKKAKKQTLLVTPQISVQDSATYGDLLFDGYVNNSLYTHKGTDSILTLACHDIDMTANQFNQIRVGLKNARNLPVFSQEMNEKRYKPDKSSFDADFRWLIAHLAREYYPSEVRGVPQSAIKSLIPATYNRENLNPGWFKVYYVQSPSAFKASIKTVEDLDMNRSTWDENLRVRATDPSVLNPVRHKGFYTLKSGLSEALNDLCSFSGERLGYVSYDMFGYEVFCVYKRDNKANTVPLGTKGVVNVVNFQNLLDTPTVAPNGSMKVSMLFNRDCEAWGYICLLLDSTYTGKQEETGLLNINNLNFFTPAGGKMIVPLGGSTSNAAIATTQLSTSMPVAAAAHAQKLAAENGYMFNVPFLMVKVTHKLSTHGKNWSTVIQTVPMMYGEKK